MAAESKYHTASPRHAMIRRSGSGWLLVTLIAGQTDLRVNRWTQTADVRCDGKPAACAPKNVVA
jgi:hypothetical protein